VRAGLAWGAAAVCAEARVLGSPGLASAAAWPSLHASCMLAYPCWEAAGGLPAEGRGRACSLARLATPACGLAPVVIAGARRQGALRLGCMGLQSVRVEGRHAMRSCAWAEAAGGGLGDATHLLVWPVLQLLLSKSAHGVTQAEQCAQSSGEAFSAVLLVWGVARAHACSALFQPGHGPVAVL